ncbi:uncharacterized protein Z519_03767 [Cladophialophora bantiana CBS 173.52]|uniref:BZIP domain-containing protein n=1 Tax=Cladophialophora bantiana (strain ATCC 10958 / CBS 173.52 / CDC B-1940 / NIH 8579) TaxID=1442370 RepID=A0A0D2HP57_CLAB1|nr:uncharacterized protein Z519_03767 [Cladophialophora bantiana CBS 173.52]KIW95183.1 hypothetical protein Z519_03767 [Cladophialophora bantiana CBS 173.52]
MGRARAEDDNWFGVQDPRKRKQIQDRLAQRARRKRLAEARKSVEALCPDSRDCDGNSGPSPSSSSSNQEDSLCLVPKVPRLPALYQALVPTSKPDTFVTTSVSGSIYGALYQNGAMMGIACSVVVPSKSSPVGPEIPESLRPTALQLTTIHPTWIDRFPFPKMRDNMITLMGIINEEEFLADLFCLTSFTLNPGAASWDPTAWKIGKEFSAKWGYLFY